MEMRGYKLGCADETVSFDVTLSYPGGFSIGQVMEKIGEKVSDSGLHTELLTNYDPVIFEKDSQMCIRDSKNVIGHLPEYEHVLLNYVEPWKVFAFCKA